MKRREVLFHWKADKELEKFGGDVVLKFDKIVRSIVLGHRLARKKFKKVSGTNLYEMRVRVKNCIYRGIGSYFESRFVVLLFFKKKTKKIPRDSIDTASYRLRELTS